MLNGSTDSPSQKVERLELLKGQPTSSDLMKRVAPRVASKWEKIGLLLDINYSEIEIISRNKGDAILCFMTVCEKWRKSGSSSYTWATIIDDILKAEAVGEVQLAKELEEWVIQNSK